MIRTVQKYESKKLEFFETKGETEMGLTRKGCS